MPIIGTTSKVQIVQCLVEGYDLMPGQKVWFDAGEEEMV